MIVKGLLLLSWLYIVFGVIGIFRFPNLYAKLLTSSKIDTVATITILFALILHAGWNGYAAKLIILLIFILCTSPVSNHIIARSAYLNGIKVKKEGDY